MKLNSWCKLLKIQKMERMIPAFALTYINIIPFCTIKVNISQFFDCEVM